jgi:acyl-CoA thioester hydrolase
MTDSNGDGWRGHTLRVRYGETDQMGVAYHANYLVYMEEGRTRLMAALGCPYSEIERTGVGLVVRKAALRFRAPARYEDELDILTRIARVGGASVTFEYRIERAADRELACEGSTELACVDLTTDARPVRMLPDALREILERAAAASA